MTPALVTELKRLEREATAGPWAWEATGTQSNEWHLGQVVDEDDNLLSGQIEEGQGEVVELVCANEVATDFNDAQLIVAMRNSFPALLEAVETMHAALERTACWDCIVAGEYKPSDTHPNTDACLQAKALARVAALLAQGKERGEG